MMTITIEQQLARLARDIQLAEPVDSAIAQPPPRLDAAEQRAFAAARCINEQLGDGTRPGDDEIDLAVERVIARLIAPAPVEALAA